MAVNENIGNEVLHFISSPGHTPWCLLMNIQPCVCVTGERQEALRQQGIITL